MCRQNRRSLNFAMAQFTPSPDIIRSFSFNSSKSNPQLLLMTRNKTSTLPQQSVYKMDQAIGIPIVEGVAFNEYVTSVGNLISPSCIKFADIIPKYVCLFLESSLTVDQLVETGKLHITMQNHKLPIVPLIFRDEEIFFYNVLPTISNDLLENVLDQLEVRRTSLISYVAGDMRSLEYSHIMRFRRKVRVLQKDIAKIAKKFQINHDNYVYEITVNVPHSQQSTRSTDINFMTPRRPQSPTASTSSTTNSKTESKDDGDSKTKEQRRKRSKTINYTEEN